MTVIAAVVIFSSCTTGPDIDPGATARTYGARAAQLFSDGNLPAAVREYQKAYIQAARADLPLMQARYLFNIGRVWLEAGVADSAELAFRAAYREFVYYRDTADARTTAGFVALVYCRRGMYDSAFHWYQNGRPATLVRSGEIAFWLTIQAHLAMLQNRFPEASAWLDKAYERYKKEKSWNGLAQTDYYRARVAFMQNKHSDARTFLTSSLAALDHTPERYRRWRVLAASALVSFCLADTEAGERFYRRALDCAPKGTFVPDIEDLQHCRGPWPE